MDIMKGLVTMAPHLFEGGEGGGGRGREGEGMGGRGGVQERLTMAQVVTLLQ